MFGIVLTPAVLMSRDWHNICLPSSTISYQCLSAYKTWLWVYMYTYVCLPGWHTRIYICMRLH